MNDFSQYQQSETPPPLPPPPAVAQPTPPAPPPRRRRSLGRRLLRLAVGFCTLVGALTLIGIVAASFIPESDVDFGIDEYPRLTEIWSSGQGDTKVARIQLHGTIQLGGESGLWGAASDSSADAAYRAILRATADPEIAGILLEIDSGGGGLTASDIIYDALVRFTSSDKKRIVVVHMGDIAASGAYYISLAAGHIVAHPTTITGSIGVIMFTYNMRQLAEKIGIRDDSIKSGGNKDILNPLTDMSPEQREMLQSLVDRQHDKFVQLVVRERLLPEEDVRKLADGSIYHADQALEMGLIDSIGYRQDAEKTIRSMLKSDVRFVRYTRKTSLRDMISSPSFWGSVISHTLPRGNVESALQLR